MALHAHRSGEGAQALADEIVTRGGKAHVFRADLGTTTAPAALARDVVAEFGRLDVLVNSAASMERTPLESVTEADWDRVFALNARAPFFLTLAAARAMGDGRGVVVNISDHMAFESWPAFVPHSVSKAAVVAMTRGLAAALAPRVRVNAVAPGAVLAPDGWPAAERALYERATPIGRVGTPEDVAGAVLYLVLAPYVTGEVLFVDGGRHGAR